MFGGRQFVNRTKNQKFTLDNIIDCFSKLSANEPNKKSKMREIRARIKKLDHDGSLQLKNSFFLTRILTWIRQYFSSMFFNRSNELAKIEILMKELPSAAVSIQEQISSHLKNHPQLAELLIEQSDEEIIHFIKYILETRNIYASNGNSVEHKQFLDSIIQFLRKETAEIISLRIHLPSPEPVARDIDDIQRELNPPQPQSATYNLSQEPIPPRAESITDKEPRLPTPELVAQNVNDESQQPNQSSVQSTPPSPEPVAQDIDDIRQEQNPPQPQSATYNLSQEPIPPRAESITDKEPRPRTPEPVVQNADNFLSQVEDIRSHPPASPLDRTRNGKSTLPKTKVYHRDDILSEAEYIHFEPIDGAPNVVAKVTRDGKWVIQQQQGKTACTAAVTAMLIKDRYNPIHIKNLQSEIRGDEDVILALKQAGLTPILNKYEREPANKMDVLQKEIEKSGSAIVTINHEGVGNHAIIVDKITDEGVSIRDPYHGWAIIVKRDAFAASLVLTKIIQAKSNSAADAPLRHEDPQQPIQPTERTLAAKVIQADNILPQVEDIRPHPRASLHDRIRDGQSILPNTKVYHRDEILSKAEYLCSDPIDDDPNVVAKLTRNGKWVIQQQGRTACTAAVTAMLIKDHYKPIHIENLQSEIRRDEDVIRDLEQAGLTPIHNKYEREPADKMDVLQKEIEKSGSAIVTINHEGVGNHAIIVDKITNDGVSIRDPYHGWAIMVKRDAFAASLVLTEIIQVKPNLIQENLPLDPIDSENVVNDEVASFLHAITEIEDVKMEYTIEDLIKIATHAFDRVDQSLIALKRHASIETIRSYEHALKNALNVYNGIIRIKAANNINNLIFDSTLLNYNKELIQQYAVYDEFIKRFMPASDRTQSKSIPIDLEDYLKKSCKGISLVDAKKMIASGETLVEKILLGEIHSGSKQDLVNLSWFLMNKAVEIGQGFDEGAFVIEGQGKKIHDFLLKSTADSPVYPRPSTHFKNRSPNSHWGIDVHNKMPAYKRTLLFSMATNQDGSEVLFIKPENFSARITFSLYGLFEAIIEHGGEMLVAQANKVFYPGSDDLPNMRKERVPVKILNDFKALLPQNPQKEILANANLYGISFMHKHAKTLTTSEAKAFVDTLEKEYNHLDKRTGREVYLIL
jgi:hypothetical protein